MRLPRFAYWLARNDRKIEGEGDVVEKTIAISVFSKQFLLAFARDPSQAQDDKTNQASGFDCLIDSVSFFTLLTNSSTERRAFIK